MIYGLDTTLLVQLELADHDMHQRAVELRDRLLGEGCSFALAPLHDEHGHYSRDDEPEGDVRMTSPRNDPVCVYDEAPL